MLKNVTILKLFFFVFGVERKNKKHTRNVSINVKLKWVIEYVAAVGN
jgi:hypothetical protein